MNSTDPQDLLAERSVTCPCCSESISLVLDLSAGAQSYVEDCAVCCRPLLISYSLDADGTLALDVGAENP